MLKNIIICILIGAGIFSVLNNDRYRAENQILESENSTLTRITEDQKTTISFVEEARDSYRDYADSLEDDIQVLTGELDHFKNIVQKYEQELSSDKELELSALVKDYHQQLQECLGK